MQLAVSRHGHTDRDTERAIDRAKAKAPHHRFPRGDHLVEAIGIGDASERLT